jgi:thymidylate synthase
LFGIIFHQGVAASFGHYFSFVKTNLPDMNSQKSSEPTAQGQLPIQPIQRELSSKESSSHHKSSSVWVCFDDENVEVWSEEDVAKLMEPNSTSSKTAYILFYRHLDYSQSDSLHAVDWRINTFQQQNSLPNTTTQTSNENENISTSSSPCLSPVNKGTCIMEKDYKLVNY